MLILYVRQLRLLFGSNSQITRTQPHKNENQQCQYHLEGTIIYVDIYRRVPSAFSLRVLILHLLAIYIQLWRFRSQAQSPPEVQPLVVLQSSFPSWQHKPWQPGWPKVPHGYHEPLHLGASFFGCAGMDAKKDLRWCKGWKKTYLFCQCSANNTLFGRIGPRINGGRNESTGTSNYGVMHQQLRHVLQLWNTPKIRTKQLYLPQCSTHHDVVYSHNNNCLPALC